MSYNTFVGVGDETAWGSAIARTEFNRVYEDSAADHEAPIGMVTMMGSRDTLLTYKQTEKGSMSIVQPFLYDGHDLMLQHMFGEVTTTGAGSPYTSVFKLGEDMHGRETTPLVGLTLELGQDLLGQSVLGLGARCRSFTFNFRTDEEVKMTSDWVCKSALLGTATASPTYPVYSTEIVKPKSIVVSLDDGGGLDPVSVYGLEFTVSQNLRDDKAFLGEAYIDAPTAAGKREITGTIELPFDVTSKPFYDDYIANASAGIEVVCTGVGPRVTTFQLSNVVFTGKTPGLQEGDDQDFTLPFTALYDATDTAVKLTQINGSPGIATNPV